MAEQEHEFFESVLWLIRATARHLRLVVVFVATLTLAAIVGTGFIDKKYEATALLLPPIPDAAGIQRVAAEIGAISKLLGGGLYDTREADILEAIFNSSELQLDVAERFNLVQVYELDKNKKRPAKKADLLKVFRKQFSVEFNEADFLELSFRDKSPERAKELLDYMIAKADSLYSKLQAVEAKNSESYYSRRVALARASVDSIQREMVLFQQKHGIVDPEIQYEETVKLLSSAVKEQEQAASEMRIEAKERGENSLRYSQLKSRYEAATQSVAQLKKKRDSVLLPLADAPALIQTYTSLRLDLGLQMQLLEGLQLQVELAQLQEKKGASKFFLIEKPWVNDKKVSPPRMAIVAVTCTLSFVIAILIAASLEFYAEQRKNNGRLYHLLCTTREALTRKKR